MISIILILSIQFNLSDFIFHATMANSWVLFWGYHCFSCQEGKSVGATTGKYQLWCIDSELSSPGPSPFQGIRKHLGTLTFSQKVPNGSPLNRLGYQQVIFYNWTSLPHQNSSNHQYLDKLQIYKFTIRSPFFCYLKSLTHCIFLFRFCHVRRQIVIIDAPR